MSVSSVSQSSNVWPNRFFDFSNQNYEFVESKKKVLGVGVYISFRGYRARARERAQAKSIPRRAVIIPTILSPPSTKVMGNPKQSGRALMRRNTKMSVPR